MASVATIIRGSYDQKYRAENKFNVENIENISNVTMSFPIDKRKIFIPKALPQNAANILADSDFQERNDGGIFSFTFSVGNESPFPLRNLSSMFGQFNRNQLCICQVDDISVIIGEGMMFTSTFNPLVIVGHTITNGLVRQAALVERNPEVDGKLKTFLWNKIIKGFVENGDVEITDLQSIVVSPHMSPDIVQTQWNRIKEILRNNADKLFYQI